MGHPYNNTQKIEIKNLSAQRFVGTDIQKNLFYGRDIPQLRYEYTFKYEAVNNDYSTYQYNLLKTGDFVQLYLDRPNLKAEHTGIIRGENIDYPTMAPTHSGLARELPFDRPVLAPNPSGFHEPAVREVAYSNFKYKESDVIYIDYDRPEVAAAPRGDMLGLVPVQADTISFMFQTGVYYPGDHIPTKADVSEAMEPAVDRISFFFHTGRYDGPSS